MSGATVHFASLMDICHLKNAELEAKHQKYKGQVVLRGDIVKDNSGSYAVFTEQGSSASQMTAAKIMDIISRLPGCDGQAADAVSAYTQVKMEDAPRLLKIFESECPDVWIRLPRQKWPKSWSSMEDPVVPLERNLYGHPLAGLLWERQFEKILLKYGWEKVSNWEGFFVNREKRQFLSVYVDDIKLTGKKQNIDPMWKVPNKEVDLGEPTSFLDHVYLGCTQRQCEINKDIVDNNRTKFESRISAGATAKLPYSENLRISSWSYDMESHARNVWNEVVGWRTKRLNNCTKYLLHALMTIISEKKNWNPWENCQKYALILFWNACSWHVLEDLIFCGQWTNLHDRLRNGPKYVTNDYVVWYLTSLTHVITRHYWYVGNTAQCFKTQILQEILRIHNLLRVAFLEVIRLFQSAGCARNKLQFRTVQQNQKSSFWMQDWG